MSTAQEVVLLLGSNRMKNERGGRVSDMGGSRLTSSVVQGALVPLSLLRHNKQDSLASPQPRQHLHTFPAPETRPHYANRDSSASARDSKVERRRSKARTKSPLTHLHRLSSPLARSVLSLPGLHRGRYTPGRCHHPLPASNREIAYPRFPQGPAFSKLSPTKSDDAP